MAKFNRGGVIPVGPKSAVKSTSGFDTGPDITNHQGGAGYTRDDKSELLLLAASFMGGESNFYEAEAARYNRLRQLIGRVAAIDTNRGWLLDFVSWLRGDAGLRTVALVAGIESGRERVVAGHLGGNRQLVSAGLRRADEPAEAIAYWLSRYGKSLPYWFRKGVGDAATRIYNEYGFLKYGDQASATVNMKDVLRLTYPAPGSELQARLFRYITHGDIPSEFEVGESLPMITARKWLQSVPREERIAYVQNSTGDVFRNAGFTWENLSEWSPEGMTGRMWDAIIPSMGVMALVRNLRNFDMKGISDESVVIAKAKMQDGVLKSGLLPYQIYQAYRSLESVRWSETLEMMLAVSTANIPRLRGKTLVMVDMSRSMFDDHVSSNSVVTFADVARLFGTSWKGADPEGVDLYQFGSENRWRGYDRRFYVENGLPFGGWDGRTKKIEALPGSSILRVMDNQYHCMGGTETHDAIREIGLAEDAGTIRGIDRKYNRVVIITDEQAARSQSGPLPISESIPVYTWNLNGYRAGHSRSGSHNRHTFGGLTDSAFKLIPILEAGGNAGWPWEKR